MTVVVMIPFGLAWGVALGIAAPIGWRWRRSWSPASRCLLLLLVPLAAGGWTMSLALYRYATGQGPIPPFTEDDQQRRRLWRRK